MRAQARNVRRCPPFGMLLSLMLPAAAQHFSGPPDLPSELPITGEPPELYSRIPVPRPERGEPPNGSSPPRNIPHASPLPVCTAVQPTGFLNLSTYSGKCTFVNVGWGVS
jgi:hypothetical protein